MTPEARRALSRPGRGGIGRNSRVLVRKVADEDSAVAGLPAERDGYRYVALRHEDIEVLRGFRNAQMDVLRRATRSPWSSRSAGSTSGPPAQRTRPPMVLVSILEDDRFVGYGGLTNLSWADKRPRSPSSSIPPAPPTRRSTAGTSRPSSRSWRPRLRRSGAAPAVRGDLRLLGLPIGILEEAGFVPEGRLREHVAANRGFGDSVVHGLLPGDRR